MTDDAELLRRYADHSSEAAFRELVCRHVDLVYSASLRQMRGDHHRAQEVTQMVFTDLARKAAALSRHPVLQAWLHRSSHLAALELRRREGRRHSYEKAAGYESALTNPGEPQVDWKDVGPVLDLAINELDERDRQAILLRFFGERPFAEVGRRLKLSENAARMRVERALFKLQERLERRGITSTAAALAAALAAQSVMAAPAGVATATAATAIALGGGSLGAWLTLMTSSKLPLALSAAAFIGGTAFVGLQERALARDADRIADLAEQNRAIPALVTQNKNLALSALDARSLREDAASVGILQRQVDDLEAKAAEGAATSVAPAPTTPASAVNPSNGAGAFDITKLDQRPKMLSQGRPLPPQGIPGDMSGRVLVDFIVGTDGLVYNPVAIDSSNRAFDESAVQAVSQWVFSPGQLAGQNVNVHMQVPIVFSASPEPVAPSAATWF